VEFAEAIAGRWKLSNAQRERLEAVARADEHVALDLSAREVRKLAYRLGKRPLIDLLFLKWAEDPKPAVDWRALLAIAEAWERPRFPLTGADVMRAGVPQGPLVGLVLCELEAWWIDGDFAADTSALAERLKAAVR
jgi:poly(A) polymerase